MVPMRFAVSEMIGRSSRPAAVPNDCNHDRYALQCDTHRGCSVRLAMTASVWHDSAISATTRRVDCDADAVPDPLRYQTLSIVVDRCEFPSCDATLATKSHLPIANCLSVAGFCRYPTGRRTLPKPHASLLQFPRLVTAIMVISVTMVALDLYSFGLGLFDWDTFVATRRIGVHCQHRPGSVYDAWVV